MSIIMSLFAKLDDFVLAHITRAIPSALTGPLRESCWRFARFVPPPARMTAHELLKYGARTGDAHVCDLAIANGARNYSRATYAAARGGHYDMSDLFARKSNYDSMLCGAARGGHRAICDCAIARGASNFTQMIYEAARGGHRAICERAIELEKARAISARNRYHYRENGEQIFARENIARCYKSALCGAARGGHRAICDLAISNGGFDSMGMLCSAARGGHRAICELAYSIDDSGEYECAMEAAARGGHREICELAREWIIARRRLHEATGYRMMLRGAARGGHHVLCELARKWMGSERKGAARAYRQMLSAASQKECRAICDLARVWLREIGCD